MKLVVLIAAMFTSAANPAPTKVHHKIVTADQISWAPGPPSLQPGAQAAVLYGDPSKDGVFIMRLKLPAGFRIAPHTHPRPEIVTVISGAFHIGMGKTANDRQMQKLPAGSLFAFDPGLAHYARVEEETVIQLSSTGPWAITYIDSGDDPRQKK